MLKRGK